jgi:hypothetical protein
VTSLIEIFELEYASNKTVEEIAAAVIWRELQLEPTDEDSGSTPQEWAQQAAAR